MQTTHPNIALVHQFFQAYADQDQAAISQLLAPAIRWSIPGNHPLSGVKNGPDEVLFYLSQLGRAAFQAKPIVVGVNDDYVIDCHYNWSNLAEGPQFAGMSCLLWKFADGKISEVYNFPQDQHQVDSFFQNLYE
ncbi:nuclear transport factor 2 family protein [Spirosoma sp. HMF3257]|uniref:Nuclear transport factor 2 family protein n=1 Tax=Spirosoma telluris TaxID=2183553 RepID=A0A327NUJ8_9BACT|nr:nuclear transport factor 2 family protein [Spirosoma telluris]RAI77676.1 nuclear transport factor 2 family protein [Spirosoma telluris]